MQKRTLGFIVAAALFLAGCGQPAPEGSGTMVGKNMSGEGFASDTVNIDESRYDGSSGAYAGMNSSADGFQSVYFGFDRYDLTPEMEEVIARNVANAQRKNGRIRIEGNCDEFGTDEYNYALGLKRAKAVKDAMVARGLSPQRTVLVSYGESNPVCTEQTESCYRRNRRVDLRLAQ
jgi:peptidoglycan-associated lipoprotein